MDAALQSGVRTVPSLSGTWKVPRSCTRCLYKVCCVIFPDSTRHDAGFVAVVAWAQRYRHNGGFPSPRPISKKFVLQLSGSRHLLVLTPSKDGTIPLGEIEPRAH